MRPCRRRTQLVGAGVGVGDAVGVGFGGGVCVGVAGGVGVGVGVCGGGGVGVAVGVGGGVCRMDVGVGVGDFPVGTADGGGGTSCGPPPPPVHDAMTEANIRTTAADTASRIALQRLGISNVPSRGPRSTTGLIHMEYRRVVPRQGRGSGSGLCYDVTVLPLAVRCRVDARTLPGSARSTRDRGCSSAACRRKRARSSPAPGARRRSLGERRRR